MQKSLCALILSAFALVSWAHCTPEHEGQLRALISEARAELAATVADLEAQREALAGARVEIATAQEKAAQMAAQAQQNKLAAEGWQDAANKATSRALEAEQRAAKFRGYAWKGWGAFVGLALLCGLYVAARLHPMTRMLIP